MRLYLLPISTRRNLLYAQRINKHLSSKQSLIERITARANKQWVSWEATEKGWQKKVTDFGNRAFARIPYQEWGLKSVPPQSARLKDTMGKIEVIYPKGLLQEGQIEKSLRQLATERQGLHFKWMWWSIVGMPLTIPFGLIPIIPNLPFFYLVFRAWSHWRAWSGSRHIEFLLDNRLLQPLESTPLHTAYEVYTITPEQMERLKKVNAAEKLPEVERIASAVKVIEGPRKQELSEPLSDDIPERLLLEKRSGKLVARVLNLPGLDVEIERAVAQITRSMAKEKEEKEAIEKALQSGSPSEDHQKKL